VGPDKLALRRSTRHLPRVKFKILAACTLLALFLFRVSAFAHDSVSRDPHADAAADIPLATNYVLTFTLSSDDKKPQQAELVTARRSVSFDFVDDPEHTLRFTGQLKPSEGSQVTLAYKAMLITMVTTPTNAKQAAITSGEGEVILEFNKRMTILKSARQQLAVSIRPSLPVPSPSASTAAAQP